MDVREAIRNRRSIRKYQVGAKVPREDIEKMLEAAMMAPSACNTRPWEFVVVLNEEKIRKIIEFSPYTGMMKTASAAIIVCGLPQYLGPQEKKLEYWPQDCGAAIENLLLEAEALGYGTCWCGFYPDMPRVKQLQDEFDIQSVPLAVVALGVADEKPAARGYYDAKKVRFVE